MNTLKPLCEKVREILKQRLPACFRKPASRPPKMEVQMDFPWLSKR